MVKILIFSVLSSIGSSEETSEDVSISNIINFLVVLIINYFYRMHTELLKK